ncbi:GNAT family N-acetyltransferase [Paenibacillus taichungensis]|uniref:GNAT family N-acetyltransferase n=1 Tax=Paenibacillus taichungensis TaxID=484184 RepID=UPI0038D1A448
MFPILLTERIILREIKFEDIDQIYDCFSNKETMKYYGQEPFTEKEQAKSLINHFHTIYQERKGMRWGIQLKDQEHLIGTIGFNLWSQKYKRAELGFEILPGYWRQGYATEIIPEILKYGFKELKLARIGAIVFLENDASNKIMLNLGFEHEGILRNYMYQNERSYDTNVYSMVNSNLSI